jgi:PqqA peptide cyclase
LRRPLISACSRSIFRAESWRARRDIVEITAAAHRASLYTNLITSAVGLTEKKLAVLAEARLDHVQIPIQDADAASADRMADCEGGYARKRGSCE